MGIRAIGNKVIVRDINKSEWAKKNSLYIPASGEEFQCEVVSVGKGIYDDNSGKYQGINIREGDIIIIYYAAGETFEINDETMRVVNASDIIAVIKD